MQPSPLDLFARIRERGAVRLACSRLPSSFDVVRVPCHGYLDVALLTALVLAAPGGVWLDTSVCQTCPERRGFSAARRAFDATLRLLSAMGLSPLMAFQPDRPPWPAQPKREISRRELFRALAGRAGSAAAVLAPELATESEEDQTGLPSKVVPLRRRLLLHVLRGASTQPSGALAAEGAPWAEPRIGPTCSACLLCVTFCPTTALTALETSDALEIKLDSSRCTACDVCARICPDDAVTFSPLLSVDDFLAGQARVAASFPRKPCPRCQRPFVSLPQAHLCSACQKDEELERDVAGWI